MLTYDSSRRLEKRVFSLQSSPPERMLACIKMPVKCGILGVKELHRKINLAEQSNLLGNWGNPRSILVVLYLLVSDAML